MSLWNHVDKKECLALAQRGISGGAKDNKKQSFSAGSSPFAQRTRKK